ncbi:MAG: hypothetical protein F6J97_22790 [Leptolyngbya sp. SIO4C1]|nr:hypothetical protein [Leptolyngbya sp. SIO4C1]
MLKLFYWLVISPFLIAFIIGFISQGLCYVINPDKEAMPTAADAGAADS